MGGDLPNSFDVVIVGARCGGAFLGGLLAKHGLQVLIIDKSEQLGDITPHTSCRSTGRAYWPVRDSIAN